MKHASFAVFAVVLSLALSPSALATTGETPLAPLAEISAAIDWQNPNPSEVAYIGTRAGALFLMIAKATRTGTEDDQKTADAIEEKAKTFLAVGKLFELSTETGSAEGFNRRLLLLAERYAAMMRESKELNNTFFPPAVRADVHAANEVWPYYEALADGMTGKK